MKEVIIDCQILQTAAFHRGMGKYTTKLLNAFLDLNVAKKEKFSVTILLNKNLEDRSKEIISQLGKAEVVFLDIPIDISIDTEEKYKQAQKAVTDYTDMCQKNGGELSFLVMAPFFVDFPSVFPVSPNVKKYSLVYDLIPYKIWHLQRIFPDNIYARHFQLFVEADHLFTISDAVKNDLINLIGADADIITSIDGGPFMSQADIKAATTNIPLHKPYVLFPSGPIVHKNNERAVKAFEEFNSSRDNKYTLYITSSFDKTTQESLKILSDKVEFTGNIDDSSLVAAYLGAEAVIFASLAEGLGMPVLESVLCEVPVACSNIPVLNEISNEGFYFFDPLKVDDIHQALESAVDRKDWEEKKRSHENISKKYSWSRSARILIDILSRKLPPQNKLDATIQLSLVTANALSPESSLSEKIYMPISRVFSGTGLTLREPVAEAQSPSYVAYLPQSQINKPDYNLAISRKRSLNPFYRGNKIKIVVTEKIKTTGHSRHRQLELRALPSTIDRALGVRGWQYIDSSGGVCKPGDLVDWVVRGEVS